MASSKARGEMGPGDGPSAYVEDFVELRNEDWEQACIDAPGLDGWNIGIFTIPPQLARSGEGPSH